jgi:hypothetical protein
MKKLNALRALKIGDKIALFFIGASSLNLGGMIAKGSGTPIWIGCFYGVCIAIGISWFIVKDSVT